MATPAEERSRKAMEFWGRTREKGMVYYVAVYGVLLFGGVFFVLTTVVRPLLESQTVTLTADVVLRNAAIAGGTGVLWSVLMWLFYERAYKRAQDADS